jgi:uncharacterized membrane protein (UPF0127 family)
VDRIRLFGLDIPVATSFPSRLLGLAVLRRERAGPGLLIPGCRCVHTFGMRFPLDLVFLAAGGRVVEHHRRVSPGRVVRCPGAMAVLELPTPQ